jgi:hypothetical protein
MDMPKGLGTQCQSCGKPMSDADDFGTEADGSRCEEYCRHCYVLGEFTSPDMTLAEMIERVIVIGMEKFGVSEEFARTMAEDALPDLRRWRTEDDAQ